MPWEWDRFVLGHTSVSRVEALPLEDGYTFSLSKLSDLEHLERDTLAGTGQPHDDEDLTGIDRETGVAHTDRLSGAFEDPVLVDPLLQQRHRCLGLLPEHLVEVLDDDFFHSRIPSDRAATLAALRHRPLPST